MPDSWWLKFKRAQEHMVDIRREAWRYANSHPYETVIIRQPRGQANVVRYSIRMTQQPDPYIAILFGDFVHNLRSALDHVIVASSTPRSARASAGFPVALEDPFERNGDRRFVVRDKERRKSFRRAIAGLHPDAKAIVKQFQPYQIPARADENILGAISRLENADKHRELILVGFGLENPFVLLRAGKMLSPRKIKLGSHEFLRDGAEIDSRWDEFSARNESEVNVKCRGTAMITIKITGGGKNPAPSEFRLSSTMRKALSTVRLFLRVMEPFVVRI